MEHSNGYGVYVLVWLGLLALTGLTVAVAGIQIGGLGPLAPSRKSEIAGLGIKAVIGGAMATLMTATLAGLLYIGN